MTVLISVFAAMTVSVLAFLLVPLLRQAVPIPSRVGRDLAIYRDQLAEIDRDLELGLLSAAMAEAARVEVERRMLAVDYPKSTVSVVPQRPWVLIAIIAIMVPVGAVGLYLRVGSPEIVGHGEVDDVINQLAQRMAADPSKGDGWVLLGRTYQIVERYSEAAEAYRQAIAHGVTSAETLTGYGEMLVLAGDGTISETARDAFLKAYRVDAAEYRALYYLGLAAAQSHDSKRALAIWRHLERKSPEGAPWLSLLKERIDAAALELGVDPASVEPETP